MSWAEAPRIAAMKPILVTGATGNVGAEIVRQLSGAGARVRAAVRGGSKAKLPEGAEAVLLDLHHPQTYRAALDGAERMFLLWPPGTNAQRDVFPFVAAAKAAGIEQVVFLSILGAQKLRIVPHRAVERRLEASGMDWVFLRSSYFMQNLATTHRDDIRLRGEIFIPAGAGRTSFVDVRDVAAVGVKALLEGHRNQAYDLTGDIALSYGEAATILSEVLGRPIRYTNPNPLHFLGEEPRRGYPLGLTLFMLAEYTAARFGLAAGITPVVSEVLGRPPTPFRRFAEDYKGVWLPD